MTNSSRLEASASIQEATSPKLLVFGNPLLDITVQISDDDLLRKYSLEKNGQKEVSLEKLSKLIGDAKDRYKTMKFSLGGSGLNSLRILAALGQRDLLFFGAIGEDQNGKIVREILKRSNVNARLQQLKEIKTGTCLCLCQGEARSLTANIGAALKLQMPFVETKLQVLTADPMLYYIEGFFIPEKMHIVRFLYDRFPNVTLITNLNAPYIVKTYYKDVLWICKKADIVFGNRDEFEELANIGGFQTIDDLFTYLLNDFSGDKPKKIIVTDGSNPVFFYQGNKSGMDSESSGSVEVPAVNADEIVDTTGAGDSFVAGFIHALMKEKPTRQCIEMGCEVSAKVITVIGCNLPKKQKE